MMTLQLRYEHTPILHRQPTHYWPCFVSTMCDCCWHFLMLAFLKTMLSAGCVILPSVICSSYLRSLFIVERLNKTRYQKVVLTHGPTILVVCYAYIYQIHLSNSRHLFRDVTQKVRYRNVRCSINYCNVWLCQ